MKKKKKMNNNNNNKKKKKKKKKKNKKKNNKKNKKKKCLLIKAIDQGCQTQFLEGRSPAEFSSNPAPTHIPCSFQIFQTHCCQLYTDLI